VTVCFICCSPDVLDGHSVCAEHHSPASCRKCRGNFREGSGYVKKKTPTTNIYKPQCFDALMQLGGRGTSMQIAALTGLTGNQVRAGLAAAKGVHYERNPDSRKTSGGHWCLDLDADSESTAFETSEAQTA